MNKQTKAQLIEKINQQHAIILEQQAEIERLKGELEHGRKLANKLLDEKEALGAEIEKPDRLQVILDMLHVLKEKDGVKYSIMIYPDGSGFVEDPYTLELFDFTDIDQLIAEIVLNTHKYSPD